MVARDLGVSTALPGAQSHLHCAGTRLTSYPNLRPAAVPGGHDMPLDLKEIITTRLGENYQLHERYVNRTLAKVQQTIGFDKVYAQARGAYLYDMDGAAYL